MLKRQREWAGWQRVKHNRVLCDVRQSTSRVHMNIPIYICTALASVASVCSVSATKLAMKVQHRVWRREDAAAGTQVQAGHQHEAGGAAAPRATPAHQSAAPSVAAAAAAAAQTHPQLNHNQKRPREQQGTAQTGTWEPHAKRVQGVSCTLVQQVDSSC